MPENLPESFIALQRLEKLIEEYCLEYKVKDFELTFTKKEGVRRCVIFERPDKPHKQQ